MDSVTWRWCAFEELSVFELQAINSARQTVFSIEQDCVYLDADRFALQHPRHQQILSQRRHP